MRGQIYWYARIIGLELLIVDCYERKEAIIADTSWKTKLYTALLQYLFISDVNSQIQN